MIAASMPSTTSYVTWIAIILTASLPYYASAESLRHEAAVDLEVVYFPKILSLLNEDLGLKLPTKVISEHAVSLGPGSMHSARIDVHFRGTVRAVIYKIAKYDSGRVRLSFETFSKDVAQAICEKLIEYSAIDSSIRASEGCRQYSPNLGRT